jgi:hypothetical protein
MPSFIRRRPWWSPKDIKSSELIDSGDLLGMEDLERDHRTPGQWLRSIQAYLEFMAGNAWRHPANRSNPTHVYYINAMRTLNGLAPNRIALPRNITMTPKTVRDIQIAALAARDRSSLVSELMAADANLTDRKILSHLEKHKLARMILDARERCPLQLSGAA